MRDPTAPTGTSLVLVEEGNNSDLKQETASTWTAGIDLAPSAVPGLKLSLTYYAIDYENRILVPGPTSPVDILLQESQWSVGHRSQSDCSRRSARPVTNNPL